MSPSLPFNCSSICSEKFFSFLYLERLTKKQIKLLQREADHMEDYMISEEAMDVIIKTFADVIALLYIH